MKKTVCFTGYRSSKIFTKDKPTDLLDIIERKLDQTIEDLYTQGFNHFISGMSDGFDLMAVQSVLRIKELYPDITITAAIPFAGQELRYKSHDRGIYDRVIPLVDKLHYVSESFHDRAYLDRNDYMLNKSSVVVCYYNGIRGGTMYTYNRAIEQNKKVINLYYIEGKF